MNPRHLQTFLVVRRHLNYTRAAEEVFLTQPAVSRQVRQLEEELGVRLFEQIGKSLHLTDAGETLAAEAEKLL
ncbi:MAG TPA: LysR family transcriptional regulator, partial [Gemmatimonadales bacterium]|nr:LysR family transcriptional regulator [Gemmatimonadales bacterium]